MNAHPMLAEEDLPACLKSEIRKAQMETDLEKHRAHLGDEFGSLFYHAKEDLFNLRIQWRIYRCLFGTNSERIDLLNSISGNTSRVLANSLYDIVLISIRRLTDPKNGKDPKKNSISIRNFSTHIVEQSEKQELENLVSIAIEKSLFARNWVDKKVAHSDFSVRQGAVQLEGVTRANTTEAIEAIAAVIKWVSLQKMQITLIAHPTGPMQDEVWFLTHLFEGKRAMDEKERLSRKYSTSSEYEKREALHLYHEWLSFRPEPTFDL